MSADEPDWIRTFRLSEDAVAPEAYTHLWPRDAPRQRGPVLIDLRSDIEAILGPSGRLLSGSKTAHRNAHPDHDEVLFNACLWLGRDGTEVWFGDIDLTVERHLVQAVADKLGETLLLSPEHPWRFDSLAKGLSSGYAGDLRTFVPTGHATTGREPADGPAPTDVRVLLADLHGNHPALTALMRAAGVISYTGERNPAVWVAQLGDLIHGGDDVTFADADTLTLAERSIDCQLVGNHEAPYLYPGAPAFAGMHDPDGRPPRHPYCQEQLDAWLAAGRWRAAVAVDGWLVTHAGLAPSFLQGPLADPELVAACDEQRPAEVAAALAGVINRRFVQRVSRRERDPLFDAIGRARGGIAPVGGVLWCDWGELKREVRHAGTPCGQVVGHTPMPQRRDGNQPRRLRIAEHIALINTDLAGIDDGYIACLVKAPGQPDWTGITIPRPPRPDAPLGHTTEPS